MCRCACRANRRVLAALVKFWTRLMRLPIFAAVLVNPGIPVSTPAVFAALECRSNAAMGVLPDDMSDPASVPTG